MNGNGGGGGSANGSGIGGSGIGNGSSAASGNGAGNGNGRRPGRSLHTFVAYVEDLPGVLNRVSSLFRRRGYNIESLTVGHTEPAGVSRMTIVMEADDATARLVEANLYRLVNVLRVEDVTYRPAVLRDLALIKVRAPTDVRAQVLQIVEVFRARVVDVCPEALVIEITGDEGKLGGLLEMLRPFGIIEMVRTGTVAMTRGADAITANPHFVPASVPEPILDLSAYDPRSRPNPTR